MVRIWNRLKVAEAKEHRYGKLEAISWERGEQ
jgi:hypothetical protein